ncbi:hypothetical protein OHB26_26200 [Nocardia sp. NBC_01503]|uniref:hypothetical protein n=1 Tax=Nocardia sp. NBC_01503 TaxID=2975997 RepID=UPI002E7BDEBE|nr:hypothetical protein [Nocardia sp. NBC_01503]WTL30414.1 hypothetical protein OHB26_26200 [Nocardia sp. NBC_01503]
MLTISHTFSDGTVLMPWNPGPRQGISGPVFVSVTDFLVTTDAEAQRVYETGFELGRTWPVMQGAVGLWLWARPTERRGGSISVWESERDMRRFVRWPVHTDIIKTWRGRVAVGTDSWQADRFEPDAILTRAGDTIERPHRKAA